MEERKNKVRLDEFVWEVKSMLDVCFEGAVNAAEDGFDLTLPNGQKFHLSIAERK